MRGCLFIVALAAAALVLLVVFGLPAAAASVLTAGVTDAGLVADDTTVTVSSDPPIELLGLHADTVRIQATDATYRELEIGALDVTLHDVAIVGRTAGRIEGTLDDVVVPDVDGRELTLDAIRLSGGAGEVTATTTISSADSLRLVTDAAEAALGGPPDSVELAPVDVVRVRAAGATAEGRLAVTGGDLVVRLTSGPREGEVVPLLAGGDDVPIRITSAIVTQAGSLRVSGELTIRLLG